MARYIEADRLCQGLKDMARVQDPYKQSTILGVVSTIENFPTADVVPSEQVDNLEYTLAGVMHSVDKWLEGDELNQHEVNRAATMREKTLRIVENARSEVAKEIFKEIAVAFASHYCSCLPSGANEHYEYYEGDLADAIAELKKKYINE